MISEAVQAAWGTGAERPWGGTFVSRSWCPLERWLLPAPAFAKTRQSSGAATGLQHSNLRVQTLLVRGMAVSWWAGLVLRSLGWRMPSDLHQTNEHLGMAPSPSSAKELGIIFSVLYSEAYPKHWRPKVSFNFSLINYKPGVNRKCLSISGSICKK